MPFITPNNLPTGLFCRQILIPNDPYWIGLVSGALMEFQYPSAWEQRTGITAEQAADRWLEMLNQYWVSNCEGDGMPCEGGCPEILRRIDPVSGVPQISDDGGSTWRTDPTSAIAQIVAQPPAITSGAAANRCDAASNGKQHIEDLITGCSNQLDTAITVFDLAVAVMEIVLELAILFISGGTASPLVIALAPAIWGAAHAAFEFGKSAFDAYWTTDEKDKILCALFCTIGADGSFNDAQFAAFLSRWKADATPSPAFNFVYSALKPIGAKGLSNYCSYGESADADCSSCGCACGDLEFFIHQGTLFSQDVDEDGNCVLTVDSVFTGTHDDIDIYWNATDAPVIGQNGTVHSYVITGDTDVATYRYLYFNNVISPSSAPPDQCGTGFLWESNGTGGGHAFRVVVTVSRGSSDCS